MTLKLKLLGSKGGSRQVSNSRVAAWMAMIYEIFQASEADLVKAAYSHLYDTVAQAHPEMLNEWAKRPNGSLFVGDSCAYFRDLINRRTDMKNLATGTVRNSIGYIQYLNLPQLLTISDFTRHETVRASSAILKDFGHQLEEAVCEQLCAWMLSKYSFDKNDASIAYRSTAEKRFTGRKALMNIGAMNYLAKSASSNRLKEMAPPLWLYVFGGSKVPENDEDVKGFYFTFPGLQGTGTRPDAQVFTLAVTSVDQKTAQIPWHVFCLEKDTELLTLIHAMLNFKGNAAPKTMTKPYQPKVLQPALSTVDRSFTSSPSTVDSTADSLTAAVSTVAEKLTDTYSTPEAQAVEEEAPAEEAPAEEAAYTEENYEDGYAAEDYGGEAYAEEAAYDENGEGAEGAGEGETGNWDEDWDETAMAAWDAGVVLFYDYYKQSYIYYAKPVWYDAEQNWYYYWDAEAETYNYLDDESNQQILDENVPCYPEGYAEDAELGEEEGEGQEEGGPEVEEEGAVEEKEEVLAAVPKINVVTSESSGILEPQAKAAPRPKLSMRLSVIDAGCSVAGSVECFKASDSSVLAAGVRVMEAWWMEQDPEQFHEWEKRPNGTLKVGKCKRLFEGIMNNNMELKSISATDITNMASVLSNLNIQQLVKIRVVSSNSTWERCPLEHLKRFAMKCDALIGEYFADYLVMRTYHEFEQDLREQHKTLPANEKRFMGHQALLVLGGLTHLRKSQLFFWSDTTPKPVCWFCPAHPVGGATVPKGDVTGHPTGCFFETPSYKVHFNRPRGVTIYRLVAGKSTPGFMNWDVLECKL